MPHIYLMPPPGPLKFNRRPGRLLDHYFMAVKIPKLLFVTSADINQVSVSLWDILSLVSLQQYPLVRERTVVLFCEIVIRNMSVFTCRIRMSQSSASHEKSLFTAVGSVCTHCLQHCQVNYAFIERLTNVFIG